MSLPDDNDSLEEIRKMWERFFTQCGMTPEQASLIGGAIVGKYPEPLEMHLRAVERVTTEIETVTRYLNRQIKGETQEQTELMVLPPSMDSGQSGEVKVVVDLSRMGQGNTVDLSAVRDAFIASAIARLGEDSQSSTAFALRLLDLLDVSVQRSHQSHHLSKSDVDELSEWYESLKILVHRNLDLLP